MDLLPEFAPRFWIDACRRLIEQEEFRRRKDAGAKRKTLPWERMDDTELLATLPQILASAEQNASFAQEWVDMLRGRGITWAEIGRVLGVSRQAAWERFTKKPARKSASA